MVSDGTHEGLAMLTSDMVNLITSDTIKLNACVRLKQYLLKKMDMQKMATMHQWGAMETPEGDMMMDQLLSVMQHRLANSLMIGSAAPHGRATTNLEARQEALSTSRDCARQRPPSSRGTQRPTKPSTLSSVPAIAEAKTPPVDSATPS